MSERIAPTPEALTEAYDRLSQSDQLRTLGLLIFHAHSNYGSTREAAVEFVHLAFDAIDDSVGSIPPPFTPSTGD